jgi:hypothetical protein
LTATRRRRRGGHGRGAKVPSANNPEIEKREKREARNFLLATKALAVSLVR